MFRKDNTVVFCYLYDSVLFSEHEGLISKTLKKLKNKLRVKYLGKATRFLGLDIIRNDDASISTSQEQLIVELLQCTGMEQYKSIHSPVHGTRVPNSADFEVFRKERHAIYRNIVFSLMYIATLKRLDLAVAASMLASCTNEPKWSHMVMAKGSVST